MKDEGGGLKLEGERRDVFGGGRSLKAEWPKVEGF
jgi:hypothetical protein